MGFTKSIREVGAHKIIFGVFFIWIKAFRREKVGPQIVKSESKT